MGKQKKPTVKPSKNNPAGPADKTEESKNVRGVSNDTRVIYSEERNLSDG